MEQLFDAFEMVLVIWISISIPIIMFLLVQVFGLIYKWVESEGYNRIVFGIFFHVIPVAVACWGGKITYELWLELEIFSWISDHLTEYWDSMVSPYLYLPVGLFIWIGLILVVFSGPVNWLVGIFRKMIFSKLPKIYFPIGMVGGPILILFLLRWIGYIYLENILSMLGLSLLIISIRFPEFVPELRLLPTESKWKEIGIWLSKKGRKKFLETKGREM
ncbi:hypothetical protein PEDI_51960 [Persicobacter diffluens]|uniref:Uncharacterized protein n=1 Tax=Persicobacter diffluens TaxID=981 RepID=A0AAN5AMP0_9BACT|nr:hypothetical protein PEDI_51960 [Persicobacter diffluens]